MKPRVEILAPAGSWESMTAAVNAGADAVYMGGSRFGARAYADNPEEDRFLEAIDYVHLHGCSLYMTVNTLIKEQELSELGTFLFPYYQRGLDAAIVQDLGAFSLIRRWFPDLPVHASTQMTITGVHGARQMKAMGASRIVTARELSLEEIARIRDQVDIEIESFVHGALCYCYSGQCLLSSLIGGRSGNRGRCAQPCRLPYEVRQDGAPIGKKQERYVLSLKDLCTLDLLPDIIEAGVYSLKIEGRMKSPRYTAGVVSMYRKYVDRYLEYGRDGYQVDRRDREMLLELFDRGGFTDGYYRQHNGRNMVALKEKPSFREGNQALFDLLDREYVNKKKQEPVAGRVTFHEGAPVRLSLETKTGCWVEVTGPEVQTALSQPMTEEKLLKQIRKTGDSPFVFETLQAELSGAGFLPVQALNELRRTGLSQLEETILAPFRRDAHIVAGTSGASRIGGGNERKLRLHVSLEEPDGFLEAVSHPDVSAVYLDAVGFSAEDWKALAAQCHERGKQCVLVMPHIFRREAEEYFLENRENLLEAGFDELLIRSLETVGFLREQKIEIPMVFDASVYVMNHLAAWELFRMGASRLTFSVELNSRELESLSELDCEMIGYGRLPAMVSAQCVMRTVSGCTHRPCLLTMKDRMGKELPVKNHCRFCYNTIYNPTPLSLIGQRSIVERLEPAVLRLQFTTETPEQIRQVADAYGDYFLHGKDSTIPFGEFTRGHLKRGVE